MAKTVFGMPGAGNQAHGGTPVAPGGAPGAKGGAEIPQRSGKTTPVATERPKPSPQTAPIQAPAPTAKPVMSAPMVKPASSPPGAAAPKPAGAQKTMFGMPAMKLPTAGAGQQPAPAPAQSPVQAPVATHAAADAVKPTELGMPAAQVPIDEPAMPSAAQAVVDAAASAAEFHSPSMAQQVRDGSGIQSVRQGVVDSELMTRSGGGKAWIWILVGSIVIVLLGAVVAIYLLVIRPARRTAEQMMQAPVPMQQMMQQIPTVPVQPQAQPAAPQPGMLPQPVIPPPAPAPAPTPAPAPAQ